ncbi:MAG: TonB-dependent receptor domain-containing protein [Cytophagaceae bacterium]
MRGLIFIFLCAFICPVAIAGSIKGRITDASTGEVIIDAAIAIVGEEKGTMSGLDGSYVFRNLSQGTYTISVNYVGYLKEEQTVKLVSDKDEVTLNFTLRHDDKNVTSVEVIAELDKESDEKARFDERTSDKLVNIMSAQAIEKSPDITVANVMQRISGVSLERDHTGDGQHAIIRGMPKRYNYSLINGIKIPSPDNENRYVPLDIFPADLMDRIELTKSLTPDMEGDAIGGVMNLVMRDAPKEFALKVNVGTGFNSIFFNDVNYATFNHRVVNSESPVRSNEPGYRANMNDFPLENTDIQQRGNIPFNQIYGLSIGNRYGKSKKFGVIVAGSYQNTFRGSNSTFFSTTTDRETNIPILESVTTSIRSSRQQRSGLHAKMDYKFNNKHKLDFYSSFIRLHEIETRNMVDTNLVISRSGEGTGRIEQWVRTRQRVSTIYTNNLSGKHQLAKNLEFDWSGVYSIATYEDPDMSEFMVISGRTRNSEGGFVQSPWLYDNTNYRGFWRRWRGNSDRDYAGYGNLTYTVSKRVSFKTGGMYRNKKRENYFDRYRLNPEPARQEWTGSVLDNNFVVGTTGGTTQNALNFHLDEIISAYYLMSKVNLTHKLLIVGGARVENTNLSWVSNAPSNIEGRVGQLVYTDLLPSINVRYLLTKKQNIRASYFESINRQGYFEIIPYQFYEDDQFREAGNPNLKRAYARNFDFRYELFPSSLDKVMAGVFYKNIEDPIEYTVVRRPDLGNNVFLSPGNFGVAHNYGFELDLVKYIKVFGIRGNYTFTESRITADKIEYFRNEEGMLTNRIVQETRPLQGQSRHIGNLSLLYYNSKSGTNAQLSFVYTGARIAFVSSTLGNDQWQKAMTHLDFSMEQKFLKNFVFYLKVTNLLNTPYELEIRKPNSKVAQESALQTDENRVLTRLDFFQRTILFGIRFGI